MGKQQQPWSHPVVCNQQNFWRGDCEVSAGQGSPPWHFVFGRASQWQVWPKLRHHSWDSHQSDILEKPEKSYCFFYLIYTAFDSQFNFTTLQIKLQDVNDEVPVFVEQTAPFTMDEVAMNVRALYSDIYASERLCIHKHNIAGCDCWHNQSNRQRWRNFPWAQL